MTERSLSPFLEQPRIYAGESTAYREKIARLEYEASNLKTEKKLIEQSKASLTARYEDLLAKKNDELAGLQNNFDYVFKQREELGTKLQNQKDIAGKSNGDLNSEASSLRHENRSLASKLEKFERLNNSLAGKCEHLRADLNRELTSNDQFRERILVLEGENSRLAQLNDDILERMKQLSAQIESGNSARKAEDLQLRLLALQKTNNQLQFKVDLLLQLKTSVELLKQKNASLSSKIHLLEGAEERASQLELAQMELQAKFDEYFAVISQSVASSTESSDEKDVVLSFVQSYKQLQNKNLVIFDKLNETQSKIAELEAANDALTAQINSQLVPQVLSLQASLAEKNKEVGELTKTKMLNSKEIEFLRNSLKDHDAVAARNQAASAASSESDLSKEHEAQRKATNQYLTNLEKLVDDYKKEVEKLRQLSAEVPSPNVPTKRPRLVDEDDTRARTANALRTENLELLARIKMLEDEAAIYTKKLQVAQESSRREPGRILEVRLNPFALDQLVKQETLNLLRKENEDLISKYVKHDDVDLVPRSLFARQENDKDILQGRIDQLTKKINRLRTVYAEKSKEIIAVISRYFGYTIEFIPSSMNPNDLCSKIKLVSKYLAQKEASPYLVLDVHTKSLKANGNFEFKSMCEELVSQWVSEKNQIPCFLSALNLRIWEESANKLSN